jgi:hypothetical protein
VVDYSFEASEGDRCGTGRIYRFPEGPFPEMPFAGADRFAEVYSQSPLSEEEVAHVLEKFKRMFGEAAHRQQMSPGGTSDKILSVAVMDDDAFLEYSGGIDLGAIAWQDEDGYGFIGVPRSLALGPLEDPVFVHESVHLTDYGRDWTPLWEAGVPDYLIEGKPVAIEFDYINDRSLPTEESWPRARFLAEELTGDETSMQMKYQATASQTACTFSVHDVGGLFVEFLRTRFNGGKENAIPLLSAAIKLVHQGKSLEEAFLNRFQYSLKDAEQAFVEYVRETEGKPLERLKGTVYEPIYRYPPFDAYAVVIAGERLNDTELIDLYDKWRLTEPESAEETAASEDIREFLRSHEELYRSAYVLVDDIYWDVSAPIAAFIDEWSKRGQPDGGSIQALVDKINTLVAKRIQGEPHVLETMQDYAKAILEGTLENTTFPDGSDPKDPLPS